MRTVAIDWSGELKGLGRRKIWLAEAADGRLIQLKNGHTRSEVITKLIVGAKNDPYFIVGIDFAFSFPFWLVRKNNCTSITEVWKLVEQAGENWLKECPSPFWRSRGTRILDPARPEYRHTEHAVQQKGIGRPQSVFTLVGSGQVGTGSLRGMPYLQQLSKEGFSIWPFDPPGWPQVIEIYPRVLTGRVKKLEANERYQYLVREYPSLESQFVKACAESDDAFDATVSALAMAKYLTAPVSQPLDINPQVPLEGLIWYPGWQ